MVRDSKHRPRKTEDLPESGTSGSDGKMKMTERDTWLTEEDKVKSVDNEADDAAIMTFISNTSSDGLVINGEDDDSNDDETVMLQRESSLDEEIQSTLDELESNAKQLTMHMANQAGSSVSQTSTLEVEGQEISSAVKESQATTSGHHSDFKVLTSARCTSGIPSSAPFPIHARQSHANTLHTTQHHQYDATTTRTSTTTTLDKSDSDSNSSTTHSLSSTSSSCSSTIKARGVQDKSVVVNEFGIPTFRKYKPVVSKGIQHMQRWRNLQEKNKNGGGSDGLSFPRSGSSTGGFDIGFGGLTKKGKGKERARRDSKDSLLGVSSSLNNVRLPRPRSWMNSLLSVGSNSDLPRLGGGSTSTPRQRHHSFDVQTGTPSSFRGGAELLPVSSLVLQNEFQASTPSWSNPRHAPQRLRDLGQQDYSEDEEEDEDEEAIRRVGRRNTRTSLGVLAGATQSTPNLNASPSSSTFVKRKAAPLMVRNLDDAPRGTLTPSIPPVATGRAAITKKMTNPWNRFAQEVNTPLSDREDLIGADEEETMMDEALAAERNNGTMAEEERAVLDMLDQMNETVDTFDKPSVSRAQSRVTISSAARSKRTGDESGSSVDSATPSAFPSPTRPSVKAFASAFEQGSSYSRGSSPVRGSAYSRSASPVRGNSTYSRSASPIRGNETDWSGSSSLKSSSSNAGGQGGGVKKAVEEREKLDLEVNASVGSLSSAINSVLRTKSSIGSFLSAGIMSSVASARGDNSSLLAESQGPREDTPQRKDFLRQESAPVVTSYASQTNAFLNRRPTHAADKHLTHSPHQGSNVSSSAQGSNSTFWSRPNNLPDSPSTGPTSPGLPSGSEDGMPFRFGYGYGKNRFTGYGTTDQPPLLRRLMTDMTGATSVSSFDEATSPTKGSFGATTATRLMDGEQGEAIQTSPSRLTSGIQVRDYALGTSAEVKMDLFRTPTKASTQSGSSKAPTPPQKDSSSPTHLETPRPAFANLELYSPEGGVSPANLGTPKRAKDLIKFFEQNSAPNSPQLTTRTNISSTGLGARTKRALASSAFENQIESAPASLAFRAPSAILDDSDAIQEKIGVQAAGRRRVRNRGLVAVGVEGAIGQGDLFSSIDDDEAPSEDEENHPFSAATLPKASGQRRSSRQASSSFFGKVPKTSPNGKRASSENPMGESQEAVDGGSGGRQTANAPRKSGTSPFKSGMNRLVTALTPGITKSGSGLSVAGAGSGGGGGGRQSGAGSIPPISSHLSQPPTSYRAPPPEKSREEDEQDDQRSMMSSRTMGTTRSFRQKTENGSDLQLDTQASMEMMGQPDAKPFRTGFVYYFNVHAANAKWQYAQAVLLPSAIALSWIPVGGGRVSVVLDLSACREVHSVPGPDHPSCAGDVGAKTAKEQGLSRISPWQLIFDDGVERMAVESARDRVQWVSAVWDALGSAQGTSAMRRRASTGPPAILETSPEIADVQMTSIASPPTPPPNFNIQLSDAPVQRAASWVRKVVPSGMATASMDGSNGEGIERIGSVWKSESSSERSQLEHERNQSMGDALGAGPPVPPKEKKAKKKRFVDDSSAAKFASQQGPQSPSVIRTANDPIRSIPASFEDRSVLFANQRPAHSQETLVSTVERTSDRSKSVEEFASAETHASRDGEHDDDFGPLSPRSDAIFGWNSNEERELLPGDSASQRPARSQSGTISSRFTAVARPSESRRSDTVTKQKEEIIEEKEEGGRGQ